VSIAYKVERLIYALHFPAANGKWGS